MENTIIQSAMAAIGAAFGKKTTDLTIDKLKSWFDSAANTLQGRRVPSSELEQLANKMMKNGAPMIHTGVTFRNLSRWFEIPQEEFEQTPPEQLEPEVLILHIYLEELFKKWLHDWRYEVQVGVDLEGCESIDFTPDVYGRLNTLHGDFEVCINFVCDNPPSQYRVRALLETLEAYATDKSDFKWGDVYILATPFQFGRGSTSSIRLQSQEEKYTVVKLELEDLHALKTARDADSRLIQLMQQVERARQLGPSRG